MEIGGEPQSRAILALSENELGGQVEKDHDRYRSPEQEAEEKQGFHEGAISTKGNFRPILAVSSPASLTGGEAGSFSKRVGNRRIRESSTDGSSRFTP